MRPERSQLTQGQRRVCYSRFTYPQPSELTEETRQTLLESTKLYCLPTSGYKRHRTKIASGKLMNGSVTNVSSLSV